MLITFYLIEKLLYTFKNYVLFKKKILFNILKL